MHFDPTRHHRRSIRKVGYDYSKAGAYFVTICIQNHERLLGAVVENEVHLSGAGQIVWETWHQLTSRFRCVELDAFVTMPDHVHGIIRLTKDRASHLPTDTATLPDLIRVFKSISTISINRLLGRTGIPVWQRNYHEHIIRDDVSLEKIRRYIKENPSRWTG